MILLLLFIGALIFVSFILLYFTVHAMVKYKLKKRYKILVFSCLFIFLYIGYTKVRYTFIIPAIHFIFQPHDYYEPLILDEFVFHQKGYTKTYSLPYKYPQIHAIKLTRGDNNLSKIDGLTGILKTEFFYKDQLLFEKVYMDSGSHLTDRTIYLIRFVMPLNNRYKKNISVKLTVLHPFIELKEFDNLFIEIGTIGN